MAIVSKQNALKLLGTNRGAIKKKEEREGGRIYYRFESFALSARTVRRGAIFIRQSVALSFVHTRRRRRSTQSSRRYRVARSLCLSAQYTYTSRKRQCRLSGNIFSFIRVLRAIKMPARSSVTHPTPRKSLFLGYVSPALNILSPSSDCSYVREFRTSSSRFEHFRKRMRNTRDNICSFIVGKWQDKYY